MVIAIINIIAFALVFIGSLNWGLIAIFRWNLVSAIFGPTLNAGSIIVYILVFISALWLLFALFYQRKKIMFCPEETERAEKRNYNISNRNN